MVCETNETNLDIGIPAVLLPKDAGSSLENSVSSGEGKLFVFSSMLFSFKKFHAFCHPCECMGAYVCLTFQIFGNLRIGSLF